MLCRSVGTMPPGSVPVPRSRQINRFEIAKRTTVIPEITNQFAHRCATPNPVVIAYITGTLATFQMLFIRAYQPRRAHRPSRRPSNTKRSRSTKFHAVENCVARRNPHR